MTSGVASVLVTASAAPPSVVPYRDLAPHCSSCSLREMCLPFGLEEPALGRLETIVTGRRRIRKKGSLYRAGEPFSSLYAIRVGTFKTLTLAEDGREQVTGFYMGGEILGTDGIEQNRYSCQATALEDSEVCVLPFTLLDELAHEIPSFRRNLYRCLARDACQGQKAMLLLGSMCAEERLAVFLLGLAHRYRARGFSMNEFILRMTREEIASYLGLKLETVSRLFSRLQGEGLLQVQGRAIKLLDLSALKKLAGVSE